MRRFALLSVDELNRETRPFTVVGFDSGSPYHSAKLFIEYTDVFEYMVVFEHQVADGWEIVKIMNDADSDIVFVVRKPKQ